MALMTNYSNAAAQLISKHYGMRSDALNLSAPMARHFIESVMGAKVSRSGNETTIGDTVVCGPELGALAVFIVAGLAS